MKPGAYEKANLEEYFRGLCNDVFTVHDLRSLSQGLLKDQVDLLLYSISGLEDFGIIRYVNDNYPDVKVILLTENGMGTIIENVRRGNFASLPKPFHLDELSDFITDYTQLKHT